MDSREDFVRRITEFGLGRYASEFVGLARAGIELQLEPAEDDMFAIGATKIGGDPDLAQNIAWPITSYRAGEAMTTHEALIDTPLNFLAQFDLADLAHYEAASMLPKTGLLSFFFDAHEQPWGFLTHHRGGSRVFYQADRSALERRPFPAHRLPDADRGDPVITTLRPKKALLKPFLSLPTYDQDGKYWSAEDAGFAIAEEDSAGLTELYESLCRLSEHQLFGYPVLMQSTMERQCEALSRGETRFAPSPDLNKRAKDWRLLLQLSELDDVMWALSGMLYFWIRESDLAAARFDDMWTIVQGT